MNTDRFTYLLEYAGYEWRSYSGRGMYGARCVGVVFDGRLDLSIAAKMAHSVLEECDETHIETFFKAQDELYELSVIFKRAQQDQLGLGMVLYFPNMEIKEGD